MAGRVLVWIRGTKKISETTNSLHYQKVQDDEI